MEDIFQNVGRDETAYDATFEDLALTRSRSLASADANEWFYVIDPSRLQGADWSVQVVVTPVLLGLLGAAVVVYGASHVKLSWRARPQQIPRPA